MPRREVLGARSGALLALVAAVSCLQACSDKGAERATSGAEAIRATTHCSAPGLAPALRETTIVVDTGAIAASGPDDFRSKNPELFKLLVGLGAPDQALGSGASAPRERITILAGSPGKGVLTPVFVGCVPGISNADLTALRRAPQNNGLAQYFGSDVQSVTTKDQQDFTRQLLLALVKLGRLSEPEGGTAPTDSASTRFVRLLRPLGPPGGGDPPVRRLFVFTNFDKSFPASFHSVADARAAGFKAAEQAGLGLSLAEAYIVTPSQPDDAGEAFARTFMLGSQADLRRVGPFSANGLVPAPAQVVTYSGSLVLTPSAVAPMTLRLAVTGEAQLVDSWLSYSAYRGERATPVGGQFACSGARACSLRSDPSGGLGQLWRTSTGVDPEVREDAPLGGLRFLEATETDAGLRGRVFDPVISIGRPGGGLTFSAARAKMPGI
jgi:hypothetical protein